MKTTAVSLSNKARRAKLKDQNRRAAVFQMTRSIKVLSMTLPQAETVADRDNLTARIAFLTGVRDKTVENIRRVEAMSLPAESAAAA